MAPFDGQQAVEQRLRNIIKLAMEIGRKEGLIGNHREDGIKKSEGGKDVTDKGNIRGCEIAETGENQARYKEGKR
jgi:hypothetical protein